MIVSIGTKGARMRMYGEPWRPMGRRRMPANVRMFLIRMANATFDRTIHQTSHVRLMYVQASVEIIDGDIIRAWADRYYRRYGDMVHGWVRISAELVSEDEVVVTRWFRPRGQSWLPMFGTFDTPLLEEIGLEWDMDDVS
jgi:hypothetical protein